MIGQPKIYRSRISVLLILFILAIFIFTSLSIFQERDSRGAYIFGAIFLIMMFLFTGVRYIISGDKLFIKMWFIPMGSIKILEISSINRSYNPLSAPAVSLKRLALYRYRNLSALISPVREQEFLEELKTINPRIKINIPTPGSSWRIWDWDI